jgi:hypothetical protein
MKIELAWVDALLSRWGRWAIRCGSGALGYASSSFILGDGDQHVNIDGYHSAIPRGVSDDDMDAVDDAVNKLGKVQKLVVIEVYLFGHGKSDRALAEALGISRQALQSFLQQAHSQIALDIRREGSHNPLQSANRESCLERKQPATA